MKKLFTLFSLLAFFARAFAQDNLLWMQQPSISPDGNWIAFEYKGNIFKVAATGGTASPLTITSNYNGYPIWSHDGKSIAFASDRNGNFDVFVMPANGGTATRLTFNSSKDIPFDFSTDNSEVIFGTDRHDVYSSSRFPGDAYWMKLYEVPAKGGRSVMINSAGTEYVHYNKKGDQLIFQDRKGYEDPWRKHHTSAVTRDIWAFDLNKKTYTQLSDFKGEDREPVWGDNGTFYYLSERNGTQNLFRSSLNNTATVTQLTQFDKNPVRNLSRSDNGMFVFTNNGKIYTLKEASQPQVVNISLSTDFASNQLKPMPVKGDASEMAVSPDGKEVAFVYRGEIFVTATDGATTKRITNTPYQERMVKFSPDGRSLIYSVENKDSWDIYKTSISNKNEPYFYASTILKTEPVVATPKDEFQAIYSPDGKKIAYLEERNIVKVYDLTTKKTTALIPAGINYSYADGDQYFAWSPDSQYLLAQSTEGTGWFSDEVVMIKADGSGKRINLTQSGFSDTDPQWGMNGKIMYWMTDKEGMKNLSRGSQEDVYAMFFDQAEWNKFQLSKEDFDLRKEQEKKDTVNKVLTAKNSKKSKADTAKAKTVIPFIPDLKNSEIHVQKLTISSTDLGGAKLSKDGEKLYYLARYEKGYDLWVTQPRTHETKMLAKLAASGGSLEISNDGKSLFVLASGNLMKVNAEDGKISPIKINAEMQLDAAAERAYLFEHTWKQVVKKFFDPKLQGVDWQYYHDTYKQFLPHINNNYDFQVLLSELLGELNASHTGGRYYANFPDGDETAALGLLYDEAKAGNGLAVKDIIEGGPFDVAKTHMKKGVVIDQIDGQNINGTDDWAKLLNHKAGKFTRISFHDVKSNQHYEETIKPITGRIESNDLLYKRWTVMMEHLTDSLSHGTIGYVHVRSMDDPSFRVTFDKVLGKNVSKKALIVDTRFNGGGWLHDDLVTFLSGKLYLTLRPQSHVTEGGESLNKWNKPSCVLMSEGNYSDAFIFPFAYKELKLGKLIGMPVAGTGTAVWWERQMDNSIIFGIPMISTWVPGTDHPTENHQLEPDIRVANTYNKVLAGEDEQLEAAVKEMLQETQK